MTGSIFKSARYFCDVDSGLDFVEFKYTKYVPGKGYELFSDTLRTKPECDWIEINSLKQTIPYENFLNTMVDKNFEVYQRMCTTVIDNILMGSPSNKQLMRIMRSIKILDKTFEPPYVNFKSMWQCKFMKYICEDTLPMVIDRCLNIGKLKRLFNVLKIIESALE